MLVRIDFFVRGVNNQLSTYLANGTKVVRRTNAKLMTKTTPHAIKIGFSSRDEMPSLSFAFKNRTLERVTSKTLTSSERDPVKCRNV